MKNIAFFTVPWVLLVAIQPCWAQINNFNVPVGDWNVGANWDIGFVPDASEADEVAIVSGNRIANVTGSVPQVGQLIIANTDGQTGTVNVGTAGVLNVSRFLPTDASNGSIAVSTNGGIGLLTAEGNAQISADDLFLAANGTFRIVGPDVTFEVQNAIFFSGGTYEPVITGPTHSTVELLGSNVNITMNGVIRPDFSGYTPSPGESWTLFDGARVFGAPVIDYSNVTVGPSERLSVEISTGGEHGQVGVLYFDQLLTLAVDRSSGAVSITNSGATPVDIDGYQITSTLGGLNPGAGGANWTSLQQTIGSNWRESPQNGNANAIAELKSQGSTPIASATPRSLGSVFQTPSTAPEFGVDLEDLQFTYFTPDGRSIDGIIEYSGPKVHNNFLLTVDPSTGVAAISNDSGFEIQVDGYNITSASNSLDSLGWQSLDDTNQAGGDWDESNVTVGAAVGRLTELNATGATTFTINNGTSFSLGSLFNGTEQDLIFEFLLEGDTEFRTGVVQYMTFLDGDFDLDGDVDGRDFLKWQRGESPNQLSASDLSAWQGNYGAGGAISSSLATVPEPTAPTLLMLGMLGVAAIRRK
jgi:hypothetical protein